MSNSTAVFDETTTRLFIRLTNQKLDTLEGLQQFCKPINKAFIVSLNISNNNLSGTLNIDEILAIMPKLKVIDASNNQIEDIILTKKLPEGFHLFLDNNKLHDISAYFKIGQRGTISVKGNILTESSYKKLEYATKPTSLEKVKHYTVALIRVFRGIPKSRLALYALYLSSPVHIPYIVPRLLTHGIVNSLPHISWVAAGMLCAAGLLVGLEYSALLPHQQNLQLAPAQIIRR